MDFWISKWISGFQIGFLDFRVDFWISLDFWISDWISADSVRDFFRGGPLGFLNLESPPQEHRPTITKCKDSENDSITFQPR